MKQTLKSQQSGVALVQALLITAMLLILVVQLSSDAQRNVKVAQLQAEKSRLVLKAFSTLEQTKFALLSDSRSLQSNVIAQRWNFYGSPFSLDAETSVSIQDEGGLLTLPYGIQHLPKLLGGSESSSAMQNLMLWQGTNEAGRIPANFRGGLMQFEKEVIFVPGWQAFDKSLALVTGYPTWSFNPLHAPLGLLIEVYGREIGEQVHELRQQTPVDTREIANLIRVDHEELALRPQDVVRVSVSVSSPSMQVSRSLRVKITPSDEYLPLREISL